MRLDCQRLKHSWILMKFKFSVVGLTIQRTKWKEKPWISHCIGLQAFGETRRTDWRECEASASVGMVCGNGKNGIHVNIQLEVFWHIDTNWTSNKKESKYTNWIKFAVSVGVLDYWWYHGQ